MQRRAAVPYVLFTYYISKGWDTKIYMLARVGEQTLWHFTGTHISYKGSFFRWQRVPKIKSESKEKICISRASLVVLWLRICFAIQGTPVWPLVPGDPMCLGATKPMYHKHEPEPQLWKPPTTEIPHLAPMLQTKRSFHKEKPVHPNKSSPARCS